MDLVERDAWGAKPPRSTTTREAGSLLGGVLHWFGIPDGPTDHARCDDVMRGVQAAHMADPNEHYVDIAYNHVACLHGKVYVGRGFGVQAGANGTAEANRTRYAMCVMHGRGNTVGSFTAAVQDALRELHAEWARRGAGTSVIPHGQITGSECPGPAIRRWLQANPFTTAPPPPPDGDKSRTLYPWLAAWLRWILVDGQAPSKRPASVPPFSSLTAAQRDELWELADHVNRSATLAGPRDPFFDWAEWKRAGGDAATRPGLPVPASIPTPWWDGLKRLNELAGGGD